MKSVSSILCTIFIFLLLSCESNIVFESPMPPKGKVLDAIPVEYIGTYLCESDSTYMIINDDVVYHETYVRFNTTLKIVKETEQCTIKDNLITLPNRKECIAFEYINGDSITATYHEMDTIFSFRSHEVLKEYKGHLFLNVQNKNNHWVTLMISQMEGRWLRWEKIEVPGDVENLDDITKFYSTRKTKRNKTQFVVNPTQIEFDKILTKKYLTECEILIPQTPQLLY